MSQYVLARVTSMSGIDISLFDFDRHNALYYFIINADEQIYLRYGGRDSSSPMTYLNLDSLELALHQGLEQHALFKEGKLLASVKLAPSYPKDIRSLNEAVIKRGHCVECHLITDHLATTKEAAGTLDRLQDLFVYPDIKTLGIELDVPKGLRVAKVSKAANAAGMKPGDVITTVEDRSVLTFGDLQYQIHQKKRKAVALKLTVVREDEMLGLTLALPRQWWFTDLTHRYWSPDPLVFFKASPLKASEREAYKLPADGFASRVEEVDIDALLEGAHDLEEGDVVISVNEVKRDDLTQDVTTHIKLQHRAGDEVMLGVMRGSESLQLPLRTKRQRFRKF